jgi:hypothetical protein
MATLPTGQLTFGQIRDIALRRAGNPGIVADAGTYLTQILYELYTGWEWPFLNAQAVVSLLGPTFILPADFLKTQDDRGLTLLTVNGASPNGQAVNETDPFTFTAVNVSTSTGAPQLWYADRQQGLGFLFPNPTGFTITALLRYKQLPTADVAPPLSSNPNSKDATVPVFPYHMYLIQHLFCEVLKFENDPRMVVQEQLRDKQFTLLRQSAMPLYSQIPVIPLDDDIFGATFTSDGGGEDF